MENEIIFVIKESNDGVRTVKALGNPIFTKADSFKELIYNIKKL